MFLLKIEMFTYFDPELVTLLYVSLIRPHLEYAAPVWNPYLRKHIKKLENVQLKASRICRALVKKATKRNIDCDLTIDN